MKITKLLLLGVAVLLFSCGDDDDAKPNGQALVGTWAVTSVDYQGSTTTTAQGLNLQANFTGTGKDMDMTTTFKSNPNTITNEGSYTIELTTTMMGQSVTEDYTFDEVITEGTWSLSGSKLTITTSDGPQEATIVEQTANTLKLKIEIEETETDQGFTVTTDITANYTFTKQ